LSKHFETRRESVNTTRDKQPAGHARQIAANVTSYGVRQATGRQKAPSRSIALFTAIGRASSLVSSLAAERRPGSSSK
jgi:hypothetical protein